ncbi:serine protease inhibitor 28Dc-like isoform X2 [Bacillus rossius redtenbacheri]|uniref:serine protease inhibitor 28Dc-like isoform X2 n=1 Tax=Bacillus rossius redtenbacheri TaxID=93214 RepID=UPI002FDD47EC
MDRRKTGDTPRACPRPAGMAPWLPWATAALAAAVLAAAAGGPAPWGGGNNVAVSPLDRIVFPGDARSPFSDPSSPRGALERYRQAAEAVFGVAVRLKLFLHVSDKDNFVVSPVSVAAAIGELLLGAKGRSREQLEWLLSTEDNSTGNSSSTGIAGAGDPLELHRQLGGLARLLEAADHTAEGYVLSMASAFFVQPDLRMRPSYVHAVTQLYGLQFWPLDFSGDPRKAQAFVNSWTREHTRGRIPEALPGGLAPTTSALLINAVYFSGDWQTPFDPELTVPGVFRASPHRGVKVSFMRGHLDALYAESEALGCRLVALPYKGARAAMFVVMPLKGRAEHDLQRFVAALTFRNVRDLAASAKPRPVTVVLPKMVLKDTLSIREAITKVRDKLKEGDPAGGGPPVTRVRRSRYHWRYNSRHRYYFSIPSRIDDSPEDEGDRPTTPADVDDEKLDLDMSGASADLRFRVDDVLHQVAVDVSEKGTEAAAVSASAVDYSGDVKLFKVDSPFMFFVRHEATLASLFWGIVADPTGGEGEYV